MAKDKIDDETKSLVKQIVDHYDREDIFVRYRQIRTWKKMKYFWTGYQRLYWSEVAHDWKVFDLELISQSSHDSSFYDKPVNIFRAYLESIIAALSITIPSTQCFPDDADNALDIATAKAGNRIWQLIEKHNDVSLHWLHALYVYCTEGMVACYTYPKESHEFGSYNEEKIVNEEQDAMVKVCPQCQQQLADPELINAEKDEFDPDNEDVRLHDMLDDGKMLCPQCMEEVDPELKQSKLIVPRIVGTTSKPKARVMMEVKGGLNVKVPNYARNQEECLYLIDSYETHYANVVDRYPELRDKFTGTTKLGPGAGGIYDPYERWGRLSTQYLGEYPINTVTVRNAWCRPASYNVLNDKDKVEEMKKKFPDGFKAVVVNTEVAEVENEALDDHWTLTCNPLSDYIHFDPLGQLMASLQEIFNDLISLTVQTVEHGIPQTFAKPDVVNFDQYSQLEIMPGMIVPSKPTSGNLSDAFFEVRTATLGAEVLPFGDKINELGQLVTGALPSLFGGIQQSGSKTAAQYSMSRAQALQRLQTTWKMFNTWWKNISGKVIPMQIKEIKDDERWVVKKDGNFINVFIRKAELQGKIGSVELESSEQLPATQAQQKDVLMQLMQAGNPEMMAAMADPENLESLREAIGLNNFVIPGEDDRAKQYEEIALMLESAPIPGGQVGPDGQPQMEPSVEVEPIVDNHMIHADICRRWAVSDVGRMAKIENPQGYQNILMHCKQHMDLANLMSQPPNQQGQPAPNSGPPEQESQQEKPKPMAQKLPKGQSNVPA